MCSHMLNYKLMDNLHRNDLITPTMDLSPLVNVHSIDQTQGQAWQGMASSYQDQYTLIKWWNIISKTFIMVFVNKCSTLRI